MLTLPICARKEKGFFPWGRSLSGKGYTHIRRGKEDRRVDGGWFFGLACYDNGGGKGSETKSLRAKMPPIVDSGKGKETHTILHTPKQQFIRKKRGIRMSEKEKEKGARPCRRKGKIGRDNRSRPDHKKKRDNIAPERGKD